MLRLLRVNLVLALVTVVLITMLLLGGAAPAGLPDAVPTPEPTVTR